jgi:hypothetical protein
LRQVQIMADLLILATPLALVHSVGGVGAVIGTGLVTLFHSSILSLAKMFLDPLNNDQYSGNMGINVATLIQETNVGSSRWFRSAAWVPEETLPLNRLLRTPPPPPPPPHQPPQPPPQPQWRDSAQGDTAETPRSSAG